jgi:acetyl coenzyme A synthetase (ADP forming)-like protein
MNKKDYFFSPKTVAVIGASRFPKEVGHVIFRNFMEGGFRGNAFPVNPNADRILDCKCYSSILKIRKRIELGVITVPARIVPSVLEECGKKGVPAVIIISAGFREIGNEKLEKQVEKLLKKYRMRCIGPNCLGIFDPYTQVDTFFLPRYKLERPGKGDIAFISQSGALGSVVMDWMAMKGYKISKFISYGNAVDLDEADLIEYLARDKRTRVICAYFEGVKRGRRFFEIAETVSRKKPVIVLKGGLTDEGNKATLSHTGSLAGSAEVHSAAFRQAGIIEAKDLEQIFDFARILSTQPRPKGNRVQVITDGGGFGVLATDGLVRNNLALAKMRKESINKLKKKFPSYVVLKNPIDLTGDADAERYRKAIDAALDDPNVDMIALIVLFQIPTLTSEIVEIISAANKRRKKPIVVIAAGGRYTEVLKKTLEDSGIPTFSYPGRSAEALRALCEYKG